jgi:hypothetical protein
LLKVALSTIKQTTNAFIWSFFREGYTYSLIRSCLELCQKSWYQRTINKQGLKDKRWSTKHYIEIKRSGNMKHTKDLGEPRCTKRVSSSCSDR